MAGVDAAHDGDAVDDAAVEHGDSVDHGNGRHEGQRAAGLHNLCQSPVVMTLRQVHGAACQTVGRHSLERGGVVLIGVVVERNELFRKAFVQDFRVEDAPVLHQ